MAVSSPVTLAVRAYGVPFRVHADDPALLQQMVARLPPGARRSDRPIDGAFACGVTRVGSESWQVVLGAEVQAWVPDVASALQVFEGTVRFEVARRPRHWTFVHAGVVGWHGRAILIPAQSYSGKSMLVEALVRAGATYLSDEYAVLDRRGRVYPFAQPLMRRAAFGVRERVTVQALGGTIERGPLAVGLVVATGYVPGAVWRPTPLAPGAALLTLLANTVRAQAEPARVMRVLARVAETSWAWGGDRGPADETAAAIVHEIAEWQGEGLRSIA